MTNFLEIILKNIIKVLILTSLLFVISYKQENKNKPTVEKGLIDLTNWNFSKKGLLRPNGEWEFYWNKLLEPSDFENSNLKTDYIKVLNLW